MSYIGYLTRRFAQSIPVMFGLSILVFTITRILPGDPVRLALGPTATKAQVQALRRQMGLNEPIYVQYVNWLAGILQGNWGQSLRTESDVYRDIMLRLPATLELVMVAMLLAVVLSIPLGVIAGTNKDKWPDHASRLLSLFGVSMPSFWIAILLQIVFGVWLRWLPLIGRLSSNVAPPPHVTGLYLVDSLLTGQLSTFVDALQHIILPAAALSLGTIATLTRLLRSDMIEEQRADYVTAAQSYGLPDGLIHFKYMLKNAFTSALTIMGLSFGFLVGNAFLVEIVFAWPGMATYGVNAIVFQDFNAIVGVVIVVGLFFVLINLLIDILYGYIDPRIRTEQG